VNSFLGANLKENPELHGTCNVQGQNNILPSCRPTLSVSAEGQGFPPATIPLSPNCDGKGNIFPLH